MGLVNFSAKFIPNLATLAEPLRRLTRAGVLFKWAKEQRETFEAPKKALASADILAYYDKDAKTRAINDASPEALSGILT